MIKNALAAAAVATAIVGISAPQALADGDLGSQTSGNGTSVNGNGSAQNYGNATTHGDMSPQPNVLQGSLNKPCIGALQKLNVGSVVGLVPVTVQDIPIASQQEQQQCTENTTQAEGDAPLSHLAKDIPIISENGASNN